MTSGSRHSIDELLSRDHDWTPQQRRVLDLIARGRSNRQVAEELGISIDGAKWHMREILSKLGVDSREEAAEYWRRRNGWPSRLWRVFPGGGWSACSRAANILGASVAATGLAASLMLLWIAAAEDSNRADLPGPVDMPQGDSLAPNPAGSPAFVPRNLDPLVQAAILAVEASDWSGLVELAEPTDVPCHASPGDGPGPVCGPGEQPGQPVPAVGRFVCGSAWGSLASLRSAEPEISGSYLLHSVLKGGPRFEAVGQELAPQLWALFLMDPGTSSTDAPVGFAVAFGNNGVVAFGQSCGDKNEFLVHYSSSRTGWLVQPID